MGTYTSIAVETGGTVHVSYYEYVELGNDILRYATCGPPSDCSVKANWNIYTVDDSASGVGEYSSIALQGTTVHISYHDYIDNGTPADPNDDSGHLKYATGTAGAFNYTDVDTTGTVGQYTSIAVEAGGEVHISYYDATNSDLKYATCSAGCTNINNWNTEVVDSAGQVGEYSSIAVETDGTVHISYYDYTGEKLKYASGSSGSFTIETVDDSADVGQYSSIDVTAGGTVHISYYDWDNADLKYAVR